MKKLLLISFALVTMAFGQEMVGDEKQEDLQDYVINNRAASYTDTLLGAATYDRIFTSDVDPNCNATSSFSGAGVGVPYVSIPIHTPVGENLDCAINDGTTTLNDTVISLYCEPFDPLDASANLVAYDDDGGSGLFSAITPADGALMAPNTTYYLVVSIFDPGDIGDGDFTIDFGGGVLVGEAITVPTMSEWGLILFATLMVIGGVFFMKRK